MVTKEGGALTRKWKSAEGLGDPVEQLVYASRLLGADVRITNFGGGNTSVKSTEIDPLTGASVEVLWVKASGGDLGSARRTGFASLYLDKLLGLEERYKSGVHEDDLAGIYPQCTFNLNPAAPSIDTPLHGFVPFKAVSHVHPDAVIAIAASQNAEELTEKIYGDEMGFLPWKRPGFELGLMIRDLLKAKPHIKGAVMKSHGLICWNDDWESCYELTLNLIDKAQAYIDGQGRPNPFGGSTPVENATAAEIESLLLSLRGKTSFEGKRLIAAIHGGASVEEFLSSERLDELARQGTSCPDHFLRTKIRPMVLRKGDDLDESLKSFRSEYSAYYERCKRPHSPGMRNPNPTVVLAPGIGVISLGKTATEARVTGEFYLNAINVMRGAEALDVYTPLLEQEAFDIEYWLLEEAKLKRMPPEKELSRRVAIVTGAAQGIGRATAMQMAKLGATVVLADLNEEKLDLAVDETRLEAGSADAAIGVVCDVTDGDALKRLFAQTVQKFGGVDILVVNAGAARRGAVGDTTEADYNLLNDLLMKAYFDSMGEGVRRMVAQGLGGSIIVVGSKNGVAAGSNAALYSAAKAFELHLMRTVALDYAKEGIRCNAVNPDAVVHGSGIWSTAWREQTARNLGVEPDQLEDYYRKRSLLQVEVHPEHVAEAICWLASDARSSRTTGAVVPVDGGNKEGFLR